MHAQPSAPTAIQQQQNFQQSASQLLSSLKTGTNVPEMYLDENADLGPQHILMPVPRRTYFQVAADSEYLFTDNALFTQSPKVSSTIFINTISAAFAPEAFRVGNGRLAPTVGFVSQWYNYGLGNHDLSALDFNAQTFFAGAQYLFSSWSLYGQFDYNRFLTQGTYNEFYHDFTPITGARRLYKLNDKTVFVADLKVDYHASWTAGMAGDSEDRLDAAAAFSIDYQVTSRLVVQPYYRFQYTYYSFDTLHTTDRNDYLHNIGLSAAYYFLPGLSLRGFVNADVRQSSDGFAKYKATSVGADLAYTIRF
jgi:hypothetical protein